jgi:hypothetical protein
MVEEFTYVYYSDRQKLSEVESTYFDLETGNEFPREVSEDKVTPDEVATQTPPSKSEIIDLELTS